MIRILFQLSEIAWMLWIGWSLHTTDQRLKSLEARPAQVMTAPTVMQPIRQRESWSR